MDQKIIFQVSPSLYQALVRHREVTGVPTSEFIRRAAVAALQSSQMVPPVGVIPKTAAQV